MTVLKFRISVPTIMIIVRYPVIIIVNIVFFKIFFPLLFIGSLIFWRSFTGSLVISIEWEPFNWYCKIYKIFNTLPLTQSNLKRSSISFKILLFDIDLSNRGWLFGGLSLRNVLPTEGLPIQSSG